MNQSFTTTRRRLTRAATLPTIMVLAVALSACGGIPGEGSDTTSSSEPTTSSGAPEDAGGSSGALEIAIAEGAQFEANDGPERLALPQLGDAVRVGDKIWFSGEEDGDAVVAIVDPETLEVETIELGSFEKRPVSRLAVGSDTVWAQIGESFERAGHQIVEIDIDSHEATVHALPADIEAVNEAPQGPFVIDDDPWFAAGSSLFALDPSDPATITDTIDLSTILGLDPSTRIGIASGDDRFFLSNLFDGGPTFILDPETSEVEELDGVTLAAQREIYALPTIDAGVIGIGDDSELVALDLDANESDLIPIGLTGAVIGLDAVGNVAAIVNPRDSIEAFDVSTGESTQITLGDNLDGNSVLVVGDSLWTWTTDRVVITILTPKS